MFAKHFYCLFCVMLLATTGCDQLKQLKEMHDQTAQMNQTTERLSNTTDNTYKMMGEMYDASRQGAALDLRKKLFDSIFSDKSLDKKIVNSAEYFMAFEFELWSGLGQDQNNGRRDALAKDAVTELFNHLRTIAHWSEKDFDPFANPDLPLSDNAKTNEIATFNALSAALHKTNRKQEYSAANSNAPILSMFNLIENALLAGKEIKDGKKKIEDYPLYVDEVLKNEALAVRLLRSRFNILGVVLLGRVTPIADGLWNGIKLKIFKEKWTLNLDEMNISQIRFYTAHVAEALKTKALLAKLGIEVSLDSTLKDIYLNMQLQDTKRPGIEDQQVRNDKSQFIDQLKKYIN